ncbi:Vicilin-like antimicrobial peptides 2-2 [Morus notabilis]|uniref:Vicilin-like antimicrobial peptides 2-2 n=1 Tax=Morus notabilis TaxID=981085 RepID=W9SCA8_9ROSA|nr:vicilin-like seed storage protein At2g28490 [Morus notabilis]EXB98567.1 Vicilin-like antimicrobial peptides 2-2 [Morus notabilis]
MGRRRSSRSRALSLLVLGLLLCHGLLGMAVGYDEEEEDWRREREREEKRREREEERGEDFEPFLLKDSKHVVKTDAGEMRVVKSFGGRFVQGPMRIGFIMMEPKTLFVPQYLDSSLIIFIRRGEAKLGFIYKDQLAERRLKIGDVYRIPAGSAFYLVNTGEGQRLHIICSIDTSESLTFGSFQSFFVGGGINPTSVLSGFDSEILENAFNVTHAELKEFLTSQQEGPIVYISDSRSPKLWSKFLELKESEKLEHLKKMVGFDDEEEEEEYSGGEKKEEEIWSWRKLLGSVFSNREKRPEDVKGKGKSPDSYNLYDRKPDFKNNYGWSVALDETSYSPLRKSGFGVYLVNLTAGSMMAPHINPRATEFGIVLRGSGNIQIVYPNGSLAMNTDVKEGDVFWVPRYFPFCQIASRTGPMEFFGFSTSARKNRPQFLVGASSILRSMRGPELAAAFGLTEDRLRNITDAQREAVILPSPMAAPPIQAEKIPELIKTFGSDL